MPISVRPRPQVTSGTLTPPSSSSSLVSDAHECFGERLSSESLSLERVRAAVILGRPCAGWSLRRLVGSLDLDGVYGGFVGLEDDFALPPMLRTIAQPGVAAAPGRRGVPHGSVGGGCRQCCGGSPSMSRGRCRAWVVGDLPPMPRRIAQPESRSVPGRQVAGDLPPMPRTITQARRRAPRHPH